LRRAHLLLLKLPYSAEFLEKEIQALVAVLPSGSRRVIAEDVYIGFLLPHTQIAPVHAVRWRKVLRAFSKHLIIGLNGELACSDSNDPFRIWMDELGRTGAVEGDKSKDVPFAQGGKPRIEPSVRDLIERTFGKVGLKPSTDKDRPE